MMRRFVWGLLSICGAVTCVLAFAPASQAAWPSLPDTQEASQPGDFNCDGMDDVAMVYDYGNDSTGILTMDGKRTVNLDQQPLTPYAAGLKAPVSKWRSANGQWSWAKTKLAVGDFDGDGCSDLALMYNYADAAHPSRIGFWIAFGSKSTGLQPPTYQQGLGALTFDWNAIKLISGTLSGGWTIGMLVKDPGTANTSMYFIDAAKGAWRPNVLNVNDWALKSAFHLPRGQWAWDNMKIGMFREYGDIAILYKYPGNRTALFSLTISSSLPVMAPTPRLTWDSGPGNWNWDASKLVTGDFEAQWSDDVGIAYNKGNGQSAFYYVHQGGAPVLAWSGGISWSDAKWVAGQFRPDPCLPFPANDVAILVNRNAPNNMSVYGLSNNGPDRYLLALPTFCGGGSATSKGKVSFSSNDTFWWDSGLNNWDYNRTKAG